MQALLIILPQLQILNSNMARQLDPLLIARGHSPLMVANPVALVDRNLARKRASSAVKVDNFFEMVSFHRQACAPCAEPFTTVM